MSTRAPHISSGATRRTLASLAALLVAVTVSGLALQTAGAGTAQAGYPWPVKPFDRPHPIRGSFGDPRTLFHAPPTEAGLMTGTGSFSFHWGVDISAPNGTSVYPVISGVVTQVSHDRVAVDTGHGRLFMYWHIRPLVGVGDHVQAGETNLGPIRRPFEHVHFAELENGRVVNPLQVGHLTPYEDTTVPEVESISLRRADTGSHLMSTFVRGRVLLIAEAYDSPQRPIRGIWHGLPVTPALITWKLQRWDGKLIVRQGVAADFRQTIPSKTALLELLRPGHLPEHGRLLPALQLGRAGLLPVQPDPGGVRHQERQGRRLRLGRDCNRHPRQPQLEEPAPDNPQPERLGRLLTNARAISAATGSRKVSRRSLADVRARLCDRPYV
jgi:murein DD-endopeptidase MepM/ murein hydrolase activator NlpD